MRARGAESCPACEASHTHPYAPVHAHRGDDGHVGCWGEVAAVPTPTIALTPQSPTHEPSAPPMDATDDGSLEPGVLPAETTAEGHTEAEDTEFDGAEEARGAVLTAQVAATPAGPLRSVCGGRCVRHLPTAGLCAAAGAQLTTNAVTLH